MSLQGLKLSVNLSAHRGGGAPDRHLEAAAESGFDAVHWVLNGSDTVTPDTMESACRQVAAAARRQGLTISGCTFNKASDAALTGVNRELPRAAENRILAALDQAAWLEAAVLVLPSSALSPAVEALGGAAIDDSYHLAGESLLRLRFEAQRRAVAIACCVPGDRMLGAPLETRDFLDRINSPWVGADLDLSPSTKRNPCDWVAVLTHRIRSVTIDELIAKSHGAAVAASLRSAAYDGYAVLRGVAPSPGLHKLAASWFMAP